MNIPLSGRWKKGEVSGFIDSQSKNIITNNHDGMVIPYAILKYNLTCYGSVEAQVTYCTKDVLL
jgi:hypothetical protein